MIITHFEAKHKLGSWHDFHQYGRAEVIPQSIVFALIWQRYTVTGESHFFKILRLCKVMWHFGLAGSRKYLGLCLFNSNVLSEDCLSTASLNPDQTFFLSQLYDFLSHFWQLEEVFFPPVPGAPCLFLLPCLDPFHLFLSAAQTSTFACMTSGSTWRKQEPLKDDTFINHRHFEGDADDAHQVCSGNQRTQDGSDTQRLTFTSIDKL